MKLEEIEYKGYTIEVYHDDCPDDPRDWDNLGTMVCWHSRYDLGDEQPRYDAREWYNEEIDGIAVILPLYLYDHSGIGMSTSNSRYPFNCRWDSGQVGWIYATKEKVRREYGLQRISKKALGRAREVLRIEVEVYNDYISGQTYCYAVMDREGEVVDSCGGFYALGWDYMLECARDAIDCHIKRETEKHAQRVKGWIKNRVPLIYRYGLGL